MKEYDLVLSVIDFRRVVVYLSIIKSLYSKIRIGVYTFDANGAGKNKTENTDHLFLELCKKLGAEILDNFPVHSKITILPQWSYSEKQISDFKGKVKSDKYYLLMGMMWGNLHLDKLYGLEINKYFIIDEELYRYRLTVREDEKKMEIGSTKLVEVGLPFKKYPVFPELEIDYIIAMPTPLSIPEPRNKSDFLKCICKLVSQINPNNTIAIKQHNAIEYRDIILDQKVFDALGNKFLKPFHNFFLFIIDIVSKIILRLNVSSFRGFLNNLFNIQTAIYYHKLLRRASLFSAFTPYHNFSLELFMPHVKKGLITGRSNSIYHALFAKAPVYNCVDKTTIKEDKTKMNFYSMQYFEVPYCVGELKFNEEYYGIIRDEARNRDMIEYLRSELVSQ